jgi:hypothetical protein
MKNSKNKRYGAAVSLIFAAICVGIFVAFLIEPFSCFSRLAAAFLSIYFGMEMMRRLRFNRSGKIMETKRFLFYLLASFIIFMMAADTGMIVMLDFSPLPLQIAPLIAIAVAALLLALVAGTWRHRQDYCFPTRKQIRKNIQRLKDAKKRDEEAKK